MIDRTRRAIEALPLPATCVPGPVGPPPQILSLPLTELRVDPAYQRDVSERSARLVLSIVAGWDWARFKPPVVARREDGLFDVIDGQHTCIAAASHGGIAELPCVLVDAPDAGQRALAFVGHNRARVTLTPLQLHQAAVAAGDEAAVDVDNVCRRAGALIARSNRPGRAWKPGETVAISTIKAVIRRRGVQAARRVMQLCVEARLAPVSADAILVAEDLLMAPEFDGCCEVTLALVLAGTEVWEEARRHAQARNTPYRRSVALMAAQRARRAG